MPISQYWDSVYEFDAHDAVHLALGLEPNARNVDSPRAVRDLLKRMHVAFLDTCAHFRDWLDNPHSFEVIAGDSDEIRSREMEELVDQCMNARSLSAYEAYAAYFLSWLDRNIDQFERQRFTREELGQWLNRGGIETMYAFDYEAGDDEVTPADRRAQVKELLAEHNGNKAAVARVLGISRQRVQQIVDGETKRQTLVRNSPHDPFAIVKRTS